MFKIININCPEKTDLYNKIFNNLQMTLSENKFILTFITDYDIKQINLLKECLKNFNKCYQKKYKFIEFYINDNASKECGGSERLALVLSNICSFKNSVRLVKNKKELEKLCDIYQTDINSKIKKEKW